MRPFSCRDAHWWKPQPRTDGVCAQHTRFVPEIAEVSDDEAHIQHKCRDKKHHPAVPECYHARVSDEITLGTPCVDSVQSNWNNRDGDMLD